MQDKFTVLLYDDEQILRLLQLHGTIGATEDCSNGRVCFNVSGVVSWGQADEVFDIVFGNTLRYCPQPLITIAAVK